MIYGNLQHSQQYTGISPRLDCALTYLQTHDLNAMEPGRYPLNGGIYGWRVCTCRWLCTIPLLTKIAEGCTNYCVIIHTREYVF